MTSSPPLTSTRVHLRALSRLFRIHQEIAARRYPTAGALAALLELSERTIKRELQRMRDDFGAPLVFDRARNGWRYSEPGWEPPPITINEGDLLAFFVAEQTLRAAGHTPEAALVRQSLTKLATLLPEHVSINLNTLGDALTFEQPPHVIIAASTLQTLTRAAGERRTLAFDYHSQHRNELTHRRADVLHLHHFAGDWYAISFDHLRGDIRDFHTGRITNLRETTDYFDPPPAWNRDAYLRRGFSMTRGGRSTTVSVVFDAYQARWMRERHSFHPDEQRQELPDGSLRLSFPVGRNGLDAVAR
ncbi:MAG: WYL domain-containing protein, partial [Acidobacteriota bacterium]|nr:WYL domain-containing protein [Acidobacteriota bacterium]